ncbi:MAG TPA: 23S rRNA (guanosine(2251)-2'-O)-methyltransferase RlmB [Candidatus Binataceae bacterium]|nr:23S rRNA (guanosine(2251)-2'-O)-methyltransferase RlmB [Candidatus Binataceae bacterium]
MKFERSAGAKARHGGGDTRAHREQPRHRPGAGERGVVFGVEPVRELLAAAPAMVRVLHVRLGDEGRFAEEIGRVRRAGGRAESLSREDLDRIAGPDARHQGIVALVGEYQYAPFEAILAEKPDPLVVVDGVSDPRNLGALLRSAECAGVGAIVLARDRTASITPAAVKSSAGACLHLKIAQCGNVARSLEQLKEAGYWVAALAPGGATSLYDLDVGRKLAIVVGSEARGIREIVRRGSDFIVGIPMRGKVGSLNVSVAAAVALFEIARRRALPAPGGPGSRA